MSEWVSEWMSEWVRECVCVYMFIHENPIFSERVSQWVRDLESEWMSEWVSERERVS